MRPFFRTTTVAVAAAACVVSFANAADLREAAPADAFLAVYAKHNPERDYMKDYYREVWNTVEQTQIVDKFMKAVRKNADADDMEKFDNVMAQLKAAMDPVQWDAVGDVQEVLYAQRMTVPVSEHLLLVRMGDGGAESLAEGITNLMQLAEQASQGQVTVQEQEIGGAQVRMLALPPQSPIQPLVGTLEGNVFVFASSPGILGEGMRLLADPSAESKFDDPRVAEGLAHLPEMEDSIVFFDGKLLFTKLQDLEAFIKAVGQGNPKADRVASLLGEIFREVDVPDYELTVEYTEGYQNRMASFGRLREGAAETLVGEMAMYQEPFESWSSWVPASANAYTLSGGVNLHPLYSWLMEVIPRTFPEATEGLAKFEALQDQYDVHLDADILQSFTGETVSVTMPGGVPTPFGPSSQSVFYARCANEERIRELMHRAMDALQNIPQVRNQGVGLKPVEGREGFEELTAGFFGMAGIRPVIGFQDGWMVMASHEEAVAKVDMVRSGEAQSIAETESFTRFDLPVEGPVHSISYSNTGQSIREMSMGLQQAGAMLPMMMAMAGGNQRGGGPDLSKASDFLALLPSVGRIIGKLDFMDAKLTVTKSGPDELSYMRESVQLIRPPAPAAESASPTR